MANNNLSCSGTITSAPPTVTDGSFPTNTQTIPFSLMNGGTRQFAVDFGAVVNVNSPNSFSTLPGIGAGGAVTQAQFLYLKTTAAMQFRLTYQGDATAKVEYISGLSIKEVDPSKPLTLVEVQGSGPVEYFAAGAQ